jgi:superoxide dismutase, Fe-Mn family
MKDTLNTSQKTITRRLVMGGMIAAAPVAVAAKSPVAMPKKAITVPTPIAVAGVPLPFDPKAIVGLSEKMLTSHHDNNYMGAVKRITPIREKIAAADFATMPGFELNGLKREELIAWNSKLLHEVYFSCLGTANTPDTLLSQAIEMSFGSVDKWRTEFVAMGKALGGGSGWVLLTWSPVSARLTNQWASDHTQTLANGTVLVAMDMYEHAYAIDYGAKAAAYVDAYMGALNWDHANTVFANAIA